MNRQVLKNTILGVTLAAFAAPALAQDSDSANEVQPLEVITVTARKRSQNIQDTPIAISAFSSQELKAAAFEGIIEVSRAAPGVFIETINNIPNRVDINPRFRGVTFESTSPLNRTASIFIDGVLVSGGISSISVQELERVELIKGPQSALFGRTTFSGAINYITRNPGDEFAGTASLSIASEGEYRFDGGIEGSLIDDVLGARLSVSYSDKEGHYDNSAAPGQTLGDEESFAIGGALVYEPSDRVRFRLRSSFYRDEDGPGAVIRTAGFAQHNFGGFALPGGGTTETAYRGLVQLPTGDVIGVNTDQATYDTIIGIATADPRGVGSTGMTYADLGGPGLLREGYRVSLGANFELSENVSLDVLTGYNEDEWLGYNDFDGSPQNGFIATGGRQVRDTSFEARLSGSAMEDRLNWSLGANYVDVYVESVGGFWDPVFFGGFWFAGIYGDPSETGAETTGVFGTLEYAFTDQFTAILELRSQEDEIREASLPLVSPGTFDSILPRVLLQLKPTDNSMVYFNYSVGNLPGGFNDEVGELDAVQLAEFAILAPGIGTTYDEETLENFELGWKQTALDGRLAFNLAGYYMERTDQVFSGFELVTDTSPNAGNPFRTVAFTANGASSDIFGIEADAIWQVTDALSLQGTLGVINAKIKSFPAGTNSGDFTAVFGPNANVEGQRSPRFPEKTASLSATYEVPVSLGGGSDWYTRADVFYTGEFFDENTNLAVLPEATEVNLRSGIRFERYSAELFVTNLFDEDAPTGGNNVADTSLDVRFGSPLGIFDFSRESVHVVLRDERQFGVRFTASF